MFNPFSMNYLGEILENCALPFCVQKNGWPAYTFFVADHFEAETGVLSGKLFEDGALSGVYATDGLDKKYRVYVPQYAENVYREAGVTVAFDEEGRDQFGYDRNGFYKNGRDWYGYDKYGFDPNGLDKEGFNWEGYDKQGYDRDGFNAAGYNRAGFDARGYNRKGFDKDGYDRKGYDIHGKDRQGRMKGSTAQGAKRPAMVNDKQKRPEKQAVKPGKPIKKTK